MPAQFRFIPRKYSKQFRFSDGATTTPKIKSSVFGGYEKDTHDNAKIFSACISCSSKMDHASIRCDMIELLESPYLYHEACCLSGIVHQERNGGLIGISKLVHHGRLEVASPRSYLR